MQAGAEFAAGLAGTGFSRARKRYINLEAVNSDLESLVLGFVDRVDATLGSGLRRVFLGGKEVLLNNAYTITKSIDCAVNGIINDTLDNIRCGRTEGAVYNYAPDSPAGEKAPEKIREKAQEKAQVNAPVKKSYRAKLEELCAAEKTPKIDELLSVLRGKYVNAYSVAQRKPRRMWKWTERLAHIEQMMSGYSPAGREPEYLSEMHEALKRNKYLKYKHKGIYEKLTLCLSKNK